MAKDRQFVTALARGVEVLRCFSLERPELGSTEIAEITGLPQSTVWRLCHTLQRLGLLVPGRDPQRLRPGYGLLSLGYATLAKSGVAEVAEPAMRDIAQRFGVAVSLGARDGDDMVIVARAEAPTILRLALTVGSTLPIATSALGWAWLAGLAEPERRQAMQRLRRAAGAEWPARAADIEAALAQHAAQGFVFNLRRFHPDVNAIGVPVVAAGGRRVMALNCGGAASVLTPEVLAGPIAAALRNLAARLAPALEAG
ncbi:IclR family transcriptional regulator [Roseomonas sp. AR75]|uniref:IclR family transcriptional regulator n=1 Tax=Roseomonas sp. AR75 TaxID=2562311 RepID=UPI0014856A9B|nr:IclR family transcriptional regulator [Roseomonas sp. AR75]